MTNRVDYRHRPFSTRVGEPLDGGVRQLNPSTLLADGSANFQVLLEDGERIFFRVGSHANADGSVLTVLPAAEHPTPATLDRLAHEYGLKEELDWAWAVDTIPNDLRAVAHDGLSLLSKAIFSLTIAACSF